MATRKNSGKPWTEECHDPQIINKVNEVIALYCKKEFGKKQYSREMNVKHVFNSKLLLFSDAIGVFFDILLSSSTYNLWETLGDVYDSVLYLLKKKRNKKQVAEAVQKTELKEDKQEVQEKLPQVAEPKAPQVADETVQEVDKVATHRNSAKPWTEECHDPEIILAVNNIMRYFMCGVSGYYQGPVSRNTRLVSDLKCSKSEIVMICHDIEKFVGVDIEKSICDEWETFGDLYDCVLYFQKRKGEKKQISDLTEREIYQNSENSENSQISQPKANEVYKKPWSNCYVDPDEIRKIVDMVNQNLKDKLGIDKSEITRETRLEDDLGVDSLNIVEGFEKDFDTYIPREMAEHVQTIGDLYDCIYYSFKF